VLPLEIHVIGADDDELIHAFMTEEGRLVDLTGYPEKSLSARFPLTATVTDANGNGAGDYSYSRYTRSVKHGGFIAQYPASIALRPAQAFGLRLFSWRSERGCRVG
jgi:hypothetical protein